MNFRYDFTEKTDVSKLKRQIIAYTSRQIDLEYQIYFPDYKVDCSIINPEGCNYHIISVSFSDLIRSDDSSIQQLKIIVPRLDVRFKEISLIKDVFPTDHYTGSITSSNVVETADTFCQLTKIIGKINNLKVFL